MNETAVSVAAGVAIAAVVGIIQFVINVLVKQGKLETRLDTAERDLNNLGGLIRDKNSNSNRRAS